MAIDPTALAEEQVQRQALAAQGAPTEFAQGPEQAVRVAGPAAEGMRELLSRLSSSVQQSRPSGQPARPPTPQEQGIVEDPGGLSMRGAAAEAAPEVLSDEGQARFAAMQYRAPTPAELAARADWAAQHQTTCCNRQPKRSTPKQLRLLSRPKICALALSVR
jgi:hypothetical protein